ANKRAYRCRAADRGDYCIRSRRRRQPRPLFPYTTLFRSPTRPNTISSWPRVAIRCGRSKFSRWMGTASGGYRLTERHGWRIAPRSEEHTSELQSRGQLVCRPLPEKKKKLVPFAHRLMTIL